MRTHRHMSRPVGGRIDPEIVGRPIRAIEPTARQSILG
jgi:hypothetical protein